MARSRPTRPTAPPPAAPPPPPPPAHPADHAVWSRDKSALPPDQHAAYDAVVSGFDRHEAGDDEAARAALQAVGLQSPFLEWKVLLRGLMAYSAGDDARAVENWQRLAADRLPATVAAPLRATIDPTFRAAQPPATAARLVEQHEALTADTLTDGLRQLRGELGRNKPLTSAFRRAEKLRPLLRDRAPEQVPRLANCFYRAVLSHGEPADMARYRGAFGSPADDPDFHKLEAVVLEERGGLTDANRHWAAYEAWLAGNPVGWPAAVAVRARALVLHRMAGNAAEMAAGAEDDLADLMGGFFGPPRRRGQRAARPADPTPLWRKAIELAPEWEAPARELFNHLVEAGKVADAEAVARKVLAVNPNAIPVIEGLAGLLSKSGRAAEVLELRTRALAANPLDKKLRILAAYAYIAAGRRHLIDGQLAAADAVLDAGRVIGEESSIGYYSLRAVVARKAGRPADADEYTAKALAAPGSRVAVPLNLAVNAGLAKFKPKEKKPFDDALKAALAGPATPRDANLLYAAWDMYCLEGVEYRGQKAQEKKIHELILRTPAGDGDTLDFEVMAQSAAVRNEWKLVQKLAPKLRAKFPTNPVFAFLLAEFEFAKADGYPRPQPATRLLAEAKRLAEASPEPRHKELLARIQELQQQVDPSHLFGHFFRL